MLHIQNTLKKVHTNISSLQTSYISFYESIKDRNKIVSLPKWVICLAIRLGEVLT